jgi:antirestriction protein ArdC
MGQRQDHQAPSSGERPERGNLYEEVTARIVAELEQGRVPWVQPWGSGKAALGLPRNGLSGQRYSAMTRHSRWTQGAVRRATVVCGR